MTLVNYQWVGVRWVGLAGSLDYENFTKDVLDELDRLYAFRQHRAFQGKL